jgi:hypothetical protein
MNYLKNSYTLSLMILFSTFSLSYGWSFGEIVSDAVKTTQNYTEKVKNYTKNAIKKYWDFTYGISEKIHEKGKTARTHILEVLSRRKHKKELEQAQTQKKLLQQMVSREEKLEPIYSWGLEALQNNGPEMNNDIVGISTADRQEVMGNFFGIFNGLLLNNDLKRLSSSNFSDKSPRQDLLDAYVDTIKRAKKNGSYSGKSPTFILKGSMVVVGRTTVALAVAPTFGAFVMRGDTIIYQYLFDDKDPLSESLPLQKGDYIILCSPGLMNAYIKSERYQKIMDKWILAIKKGKELLSAVKDIELQIEKAEDEKTKVRLRNDIREILPPNTNSVVNIFEQSSDRQLRAQLYCMLKDIQESAKPRGNLSSIVIRVGDTMTLLPPIILDTNEVMRALPLKKEVISVPKIKKAIEKKEETLPQMPKQVGVSVEETNGSNVALRHIAAFIQETLNKFNPTNYNGQPLVAMMELILGENYPPNATTTVAEIINRYKESGALAKSVDYYSAKEVLKIKMTQYFTSWKNNQLVYSEEAFEAEKAEVDKLFEHF